MNDSNQEPGSIENVDATTNQMYVAMVGIMQRINAGERVHNFILAADFEHTSRYEQGGNVVACMGLCTMMQMSAFKQVEDNRAIRESKDQPGY